MKKSKLLAVLLVAVMASACSANSKSTSKETVGNSQTTEHASYSYLGNIDKSKIKYVKADADWAYDMSNPNVLKQHVTNVFIGKVSSIDSATCNLPGNGYSTIPYTLGKINIEENFIGDASGVIDFSRWGGVVTTEEFNRNAPKEAVQKREYLQSKSNEKQSKYVSGYFNNDISLQPDQTYLFYANYNSKYQRYEILGFQYGTREVFDFNKSMLRSGNQDGEILNNATGQKESLNNYIKQYLQ